MTNPPREQSPAPSNTSPDHETALPGGESRPAGYGNPPEKHRFRPGRSGNPKGRPKGSRNLKTEARQIINKTFSIVVEGKKKRVSSQTLILLRLQEKAHAGDRHAMKDFLELCDRFNNEDEPLAGGVMSDDDRAILDMAFARVRGDQAGGAAPVTPGTAKSASTKPASAKSVSTNPLAKPDDINKETSHDN